ncbi:MAG: hypothetical protein LBL74_07370 [Bacteroidales bacterium]|jgi:hypothetical protein|nr:hypothetical protein [Bacteroidales bacterium]
MKTLKLFLILFMAGFVCMQSNAQSESQSSDTITYKSGSVYKSGVIISQKEVRNLLNGDSAALNAYNCGQRFKIAGSVVGVIGGASVGYVLGHYLTNSISGQELKKSTKILHSVLLVSGVVEVGLAFYLNHRGSQKIKTSIDLYNGKGSNNLSYNLSFGLNKNGLGFSLTF